MTFEKQLFQVIFQELPDSTDESDGDDGDDANDPVWTPSEDDSDG